MTGKSISAECPECVELVKFVLGTHSALHRLLESKPPTCRCCSAEIANALACLSGFFNQAAELVANDEEPDQARLQ